MHGFAGLVRDRAPYSAVMQALVLFTRDLRVHDHPALAEACHVAEHVVPLFVLDPELSGISPNRTRFLVECLVDLDRNLRRRGGGLFVRRGDAPSEAVRLAVETGCDAIFLTRDVGSYAASRLTRLRALCATAGIEVREFPGHSIVEPGDVTPSGRNAYHVFTPYLRAWSALPLRPVIDAPGRVRTPRAPDGTHVLDPRREVPSAVDLPAGGESVARRRLRTYAAADMDAYETARDDPGADLTSRLSPYLRFGCISPVEVAERARASASRGASAWVRQLAWRDYFRQRLAETPWMSWRDLRPAEPEMRAPDPALLEAWKEGRTGVPLVDAGMRQLEREGWMHNRARLVTASFLTRLAGHPWQEGARHFAFHLVDGEPSNNAGNWQWVAGTGVSARRGRALNPVRQALRSDPSGVYVRRYVPELDGLEGEALLRPWRDPEILRATGYPAPAIALGREERDAVTRSAADARSTPR